ncbi:tyrosine-protein kinase Wzc [Serratia proteamaculans]|uniref:tyrosine-protein kinase Wzc n=1 Tax=Serratia proteamaculans TaxID=28151 RepID=UPI0021778D5D|nr:tyrosine-protein kinase Wzc [Serratia proteamaculans]CAI1563535.1 Tyrosine-protein kinase wzc [Serratia proteamaculans]
MLDKSKGSASPNVAKNEDIDLGRLVGTLIDHRWLITGVTSIFALFGLVYVIFATPIYQADALVQVEQNMGSSILSDISKVLPDSQPVSATEIELIKSRMVIGKTLDEMNLDTEIEPNYFPVFGKGFARLTKKDSEIPQVALSSLRVPNYLLDEKLKLSFKNKSSYELSYSNEKILDGTVGKLSEAHGVSILVSDFQGEDGASFSVKKRPRLDAINDLVDKMTVADKGKDTGILALSLTGDDPVKIKKILNNIINNYLQQNVERKSEEAGKSLEFLKEQLPQVRQNLDLAENKLNQFRQQNDSVDLSLEAKSVLDTMVAVESQLNELTFKEAEISKLYTKEHPAYRALIEKRATLEKEKTKLNKRVSNMPKTQQEILSLTRDVQAGQEVYMQLLNKQQELSINKASTVGNVRIIDYADTQLKPVKPKKIFFVLFAVILGAVTSITLVLIKMLLHKGIDSAEELESNGINVYASIPLSEWQSAKDKELTLRGKKLNTRSNELLATGNPADLAVEAIRSLRTSLHFAMLDAKNNILMISGASPSIGKTFVSVNLAATIAQSGQKVLVIDSDMRKGYIHDIFGFNANNGLSSILAGQISAEQAVISSNVDNLDIISRGKVPPNPSELLMNERFEKLMTWASEKYDIVLIDTPPILAVTDAAIIGHHVGTSLMVARFEVNTTKEVEISIRRFDQNGIEIKGVILNAMVRKLGSYYSNYGYYQYEYKSENQGKGKK